MNGRTPRALATLALTLTLALSGCISSLTDGEGLGPSSTGGDGQGTVEVLVNADNASGLERFEVILAGVFVHDAGTPAPEGYFELDTAGAGGGAIVVGGASAAIKAGMGDVPPGSYDQVVLRYTTVRASAGAAMEGGNASGDHDHGESADDGHAHAHDHGASAEVLVDDAQGIDVPVNLSFEVKEGQTTQLELVFDAAASTAGGDFAPVIARAVVQRDGKTVAEITDVEVETGVQVSAGDTDRTAPPVARIAVFAPDGAQVYKADFLAEDGEFVNSKSGAFELGDEVRLSGSDSEAVETGATVTDFAWDFDDGSAAQGQTVSHIWEQPGVFEVRLTVTDSFGVEDTHLVRVIVLAKEWTTTLLSTSFEDGAEGWTADEGAGTPAPTTWALGGPGRESDASWHVGHQLPGLTDAGFGYTDSAHAVLTSPVFKLPSTWSSAGFTLYIAGSSESGFDFLAVDVLVGGETRTVGKFSGSQDWLQLGASDALSDAVGKDVQFVFTFTADDAVPQGEGWYVDDVAIGGVDLPLHKAHLLEEGSHDGHDHQH